MDKIIECGREFYAKLDTLKSVKVDSPNWLFYYIDDVTNEKWVEEYPHGELNGGGSPQLRLLDKFPWE